MKVTSMWFWGPVMIVFGGLMALGWSVRPRQIDAGAFFNQPAALNTSLDELIHEAATYPNVSSVTVSFKGPLRLAKEESEFWSDKQTELWSYNRRIGAMIGVFHRPKAGVVRFAKVTCESMTDARLKTLVGKGAALTVSPQEFGCRAEDPRDIGGKLPDQIQAEQQAKAAKHAKP